MYQILDGSREQLFIPTDSCAQDSIRYELLQKDAAGSDIPAAVKDIEWVSWNKSMAWVSTNTTRVFKFYVRASSAYVSNPATVMITVEILDPSTCEIILTPLQLSKVFTFSALTSTFTRPYVSLDIPRENLISSSSKCDQVTF